MDKNFREAQRQYDSMLPPEQWEEDEEEKELREFSEELELERQIEAREVR